MFGTFTFSYSPPLTSVSEESRIEMSFSSEADLPTVVKHFENFLRANGYPLNFNDSLEISRPEEEDKNFYEELSSEPFVNYGSDQLMTSSGNSLINFTTFGF